MTDALYLYDAYRTEFEADVVASEGDSLRLSTTAFYPTGGGQPSDTGTLDDLAGQSWKVTDVRKDGAGIWHRVAPERLPPRRRGCGRGSIGTGAISTCATIPAFTS